MAEIGWESVIRQKQDAEKGRHGDTATRRRGEKPNAISFSPCPRVIFSVFVAFCIFFFLFFATDALACPMCTALIEHGKDAWQAMRFGRGIAWSILLMFSVPFLLVGGATLFLVHSSRKAHKDNPFNHAGKS